MDRKNSEKKIKKENRKIIVTHEPGGTKIGEILRNVFLLNQMEIETETLLIFAMRYEHLAKVIKPALKVGNWVVCDRFIDTTFAYQCGGQGLSQKKIENLQKWIQCDIKPDLTLLFYLPIDKANIRCNISRIPDRFERKSSDFFNRIQSEYIRRAKEDPSRFIIINSDKDIQKVRNELNEIIMKL